MPTLYELEKKLAEKGYKLTKNRRILLQGLLEIADWATAQEIYDYVYKRNNKVNFSTIYRNLDALSNMGLICRINHGDATSYYSLNLEENHHHHLICKSCNKVVTLDYCPLSSLSNEDLQYFSNIECKFEVYGYCRDCQSQNRKK